MVLHDADDADARGGSASAAENGAAPTSPPSEATALVVTLRMEATAAAVFTRLRQAHFPPQRNWLAAHVTLFHALPVASLDAVLADVAEAAGATAAFSMRVDRVLFLGRGVAYALASPEGARLRTTLASRWDALLGRQDRAGPGRLHVTVQNKVEPAAARALHEQLTREFVPRDIGASGLDVWYYVGGPWRPAGSFLFSGPPASPRPA